MIKAKSVAFYIPDEMGGLMAVSKNAVTRMKKKFRSKDFCKPGQVYSMPSHKVKKGKGGNNGNARLDIQIQV